MTHRDDLTNINGWGMSTTDRRPQVHRGGPVMTVPTITLDSRHPGLMGITIRQDGAEMAYGGDLTVRLTREEAERFAIDIIAAAQQGFMQAGPTDESARIMAREAGYVGPFTP